MKSFTASGFTLIELLVAIGITATIGVASYTLLHQTLKTREHLEVQTQDLREIQFATTVIQNDLRHIVPRTIRDPYGDVRSALLVSEFGEYGFLEFTRSGVSNPLKLKRSNMRRVAYKLDNEALYKVSWTVLDQAPDSEPREQLLLENIAEIEVQLMKENKEWITVWPEPGLVSPTPNDLSLMPEAISLKIVTLNGDEYRWLEKVLKL